jgi:polysaccharide pyruvyl transferase WcaK-like protein
VSLQRFTSQVSDRGRQVFDSAFLLRPATLSGEPARVAQWIAAQRAMGQTVIAINVHGMIYPVADRKVRVESLVASLASAMDNLVQRRRVSWLLLPHDERLVAGDLEVLDLLRERISTSTAAHTCHLTNVPHASELKSLVGGVDGAFTARMHLAIAALGMGVPVMVVTYQGKFEGLLRAFGIDPTFELDADQLMDSATSLAHLERFISTLDGSRTTVRAALPRILAGARTTFTRVVPS